MKKFIITEEVSVSTPVSEIAALADEARKSPVQFEGVMFGHIYAEDDTFDVSFIYEERPDAPTRKRLKVALSEGAKALR